MRENNEFNLKSRIRVGKVINHELYVKKRKTVKLYILYRIVY